MKYTILFAALVILSSSLSAKKIKPEVITHHNYGVGNKGTTLLISFEKGEEFNHPLFPTP